MFLRSRSAQQCDPFCPGEGQVTALRVLGVADHGAPGDVCEGDAVTPVAVAGGPEVEDVRVENEVHGCSFRLP